jgi:hypothetical protein
MRGLAIRSIAAYDDEKDPQCQAKNRESPPFPISLASITPLSGMGESSV